MEDENELTDTQKAYIDSLSYDALLSRWRHAPVGDPMFRGAAGKYWAERMAALRGTVDHVGASKRIGW